MTVADYIFSFLKSKEVDTVFFLPGGGCMHLLDALSRSDMQKVSLLHEQSVGIACEGFANASGKVGVALVTSGPGATNILTPLLAAYIDSSPCFFLVGQMKTSDLREQYNVRALGSQEADIVSMAKPACKYAVQIRDASMVRFFLEKAWYEANSGRKGPVLLDIPLDIQGADIRPEELQSFAIPQETCPLDREDTQEYVKRMLAALKEAKRPLFIAGNGLFSCRKKFEELLALYPIPVITTWKALDYIPHDHPLYVGHAGGMGDRHSNITMQNADCIISFGSRLDYSITGYDRTQWATKAKKFIIDIDANELGKFSGLSEDTCCIHADVCSLLDILIEAKKAMSLQDMQSWKEHIQCWKDKYPFFTDEKCYVDKEGITSYAFIKHLSSLLPKRACVAPCSAGTTAEIFFQSFQVKEGQCIRSNHGLGSMGFEIPNAIGMSFARNGEDVICIAGDGGMQLNIQELAIIKGRNLPIKLFVINNSGYASIRNMQKGNFEERYCGCDQDHGLFLPSLKELSSAYALPYLSISSKHGIDEKIQEALKLQGAVFIEVFVDNTCMVSPKTATQIMPDGSMKSSPLENQFPFLSQKELEENSI